LLPLSHLAFEFQFFVAAQIVLRRWLTYTHSHFHFPIILEKATSQETLSFTDIRPSNRAVFTSSLGVLGRQV
jgi:hypothetical protein